MRDVLVMAVYHKFIIPCIGTILCRYHVWILRDVSETSISRVSLSMFVVIVAIVRK